MTALATYLHSRLINDFSLFHPESPLTALANQPDLAPVGACLALWNPPTSGYNVYVKNMKVINQMSEDNLVAAQQSDSTLSIQRISAYTTNALTDHVQYVTKMDSNNLDIPSQVSILSRADGVTTVSTVRQFINLPENGNTIAPLSRTIAIHPAKRFGIDGLDTCDIYQSGYGNPAVQAQTLREGEGIAIVPNNVQNNVCYRFHILFNIGSSTYLASESIRPYALTCPMLIFNGAGSGVIISILDIECQEIGTDEMCAFAVQKIDGIYNTVYATNVSNYVVPMDSQSPLPSSIAVYENVLVSLYGAKHGSIMSNPSYRRNVQMWVGTGPTWASGVRMYGTVSSSEIIDNGVTPIVIRPGEGLALLQKNSSGMGRYEATMLFQVESEGEYDLTRNTGTFPSTYDETDKYGTFGNKLTSSSN